VALSADHTGHAGEMPVRGGFAFKLFVVFAVLALLSAGISLAGRQAGRTIAMAGHSDDPTTREVVIGNDVLSVPANMIRFEEARRSGIASRLDLYLRWPEMDGYTHAARDAFNHADGQRGIIFLSFESRVMSRDMSGRYDPIYRSLIEPQGRVGPGDLSVHRFSEKSGYVDEVLVVGEAEGGDRFIARCLTGQAAVQSLAPCERDIHVGEALNMVYRFPAELAGSWRDMEAAVRRTAASMLRTGAEPRQSRSTSRIAIEKL